MSEQPIKFYNKEELLNESKVFCMFPWLHLNATPKGDIYPCCSNNYTAPIGNTKDMSLKEAFNSPQMKQLRLDMLEGKPSKICDFCYKHEEAGPHSFRHYAKENFGKYFDEIVPTTQDDGTVEEFKMRYFDIRFSNICNMKCRTCGAEFSSQWAQENRIYNKNRPIIMHVDNHKGNILNEVLEHVDDMDLAYFAGGEPTLTEEHYIMLEDMIRKGRTDIVLRYNTNASNLIYKDYDLLDLWKNFNRIELSCSIDHYGERAEWMRKGTDWGVVESNLKLFRNLDTVLFQINTVFSIFNYLTIGEFYTYMKDKDLLRSEDWYHSLYLAVHPSYYSAKSLPKELKELAKNKAKSFNFGNGEGYPVLTRLVSDAISFADESHTWKDNKEQFFQHVLAVDRIRGESFFNTFPELTKLVIATE
jgi:MoaA/NifB/PqqE/SkfB family radical SAM enzyme